MAVLGREANGMLEMMKRRGVLLVVLVLLAAGCGTQPKPSTATPSLPTPALPTPTTAIQTVGLPTLPSPTPCGAADVAVDRGPYVIAGIQVPGFFPNMGPSGWQNDDVVLRQVVVVASVVAQEVPAFGGEAHVYTPFAIDVERVIHGQASPGRTLVAIEGGTVGCYSVHVDTVPTLRVGARYVLFLPGPIGSQPPPEVWDVWAVDDQNVVSTYQGQMPLSALVERIDRLAAASSATP
jgi:hypothetical protein